MIKRVLSFYGTFNVTLLTSFFWSGNANQNLPERDLNARKGTEKKFAFFQRPQNMPYLMN